MASIFLSVAKTLILTMSGVLVVLIGLFALSIGYTEAHVNRQFGNITLNVGWETEPPLVGELNNIIVQVQENKSGKLEPVLNALADVDSSVFFGTLSESIDFKPTEETPGLFVSEIIPTRIGSYAVRLQGDIKGENISTRFEIEEVEGKESISFPDKTGSGEDSNLAPMVQSVLSQLAIDIDNTKSRIDLIENRVKGVELNFEMSKSSTELNYLISFAALGAGIGGMVMAAYFMQRKNRV